MIVSAAPGSRTAELEQWKSSCGAIGGRRGFWRYAPGISTKYQYTALLNSSDQQWWGWISHVARWTTAVSVRVHVSVCAGTEEVEATIDGYDSSPAGGPSDSSTGGYCAVHRLDPSRWHERYVLRCNSERMLRGHSSGLEGLWCGQLVWQYFVLG